MEDEKWYSDEHSLGLLVFSPLFFGDGAVAFFVL